jgi:hypothetical protein
MVRASTATDKWIHFFSTVVLMVLVVSLDVGRKARGLYHVEDARRFASYWYLVMITKLTFRFF